MSDTRMTHLGPYQILDQIAQGAYGEVLRARHVGPAGFQRLLAIKRLRPHVLQDASAVRAFENEARIGGLLLHHNIAQTIEFRQDDGQYYLVMEYVDGFSFQQLIAFHRSRQEWMPIGIALELIAQACEGLHYAHEAKSAEGVPLKLIHRDIKPSNLMLTTTGVVKVMDFGIARVENQNLTDAGFIKGTPRYLSPEMISRAAPVDRRSDLFSLGSVLYELLAQKPLFDAATLMQLMGRVRDADVAQPLKELTARFPQLIPLLNKMLAGTPERRFQTARELGRELRKLARELDAEDVDLEAYAGQIQNFSRQQKSDEANRAASMRRTEGKVMPLDTLVKGTPPPLQTPRQPDNTDTLGSKGAQNTIDLLNGLAERAGLMDFQVLPPNLPNRNGPPSPPFQAAGDDKTMLPPNLPNRNRPPSPPFQAAGDDKTMLPPPFPTRTASPGRPPNPSLPAQIPDPLRSTPMVPVKPIPSARPVNLSPAPAMTAPAPTSRPADDDEEDEEEEDTVQTFSGEIKVPESQPAPAITSASPAPVVASVPPPVADAADNEDTEEPEMELSPEDDLPPIPPPPQIGFDDDWGDEKSRVVSMEELGLLRADQAAMTEQVFRTVSDIPIPGAFSVGRSPDNPRSTGPRAHLSSLANSPAQSTPKPNVAPMAELPTTAASARLSSASPKPNVAPMAELPTTAVSARVNVPPVSEQATTALNLSKAPAQGAGSTSGPSSRPESRAQLAQAVELPTQALVLPKSGLPPVSASDPLASQQTRASARPSAGAGATLVLPPALPADAPREFDDIATRVMGAATPSSSGAPGAEFQNMATRMVPMAGADPSSSSSFQGMATRMISPHGAADGFSNVATKMVSVPGIDEDTDAVGQSTIALPSSSARSTLHLPPQSVAAQQLLTQAGLKSTAPRTTTPMPRPSLEPGKIVFRGARKTAEKGNSPLVWVGVGLIAVVFIVVLLTQLV
ncbi:MAG: protein kinase domain-containing protein [Myxococcota bacterium]